MQNPSSNFWQPTASLENLKKRAKIINIIRAFFCEKNILEVDTPLLSCAGVTDVHLANITVNYQATTNAPIQTLYLQTSPEYYMKRLLAAGCGDIFQITKAFRNGEVGHLHQPEFTMLEWYRIGFTHLELMTEVDELLQTVLRTSSADRFTYQEIFLRYLKLDPFESSIEVLKNCASEHEIYLEHIKNDPLENDRDFWLQLLLSHLIEPQLGQERPVFIYDFPITQAALAKIRRDDPPVAERFEVYYQGIELANGFHELTDAEEQRARFEKNLQERIKLNLSAVPIDQEFLNALKSGLPECAGVALGIDRLVLLAIVSKKSFPKEILSIAKVLSFKTIE